MKILFSRCYLCLIECEYKLAQTFYFHLTWFISVRDAYYNCVVIRVNCIVIHNTEPTALCTVMTDWNSNTDCDEGCTDMSDFEW